MMSLEFLASDAAEPDNRGYWSMDKARIGKQPFSTPPYRFYKLTVSQLCRDTRLPPPPAATVFPPLFVSTQNEPDLLRGRFSPSPGAPVSAKFVLFGAGFNGTVVA